MWIYILPVTAYTISVPIYKSLNQNFFKKWSEDMAYVLGFFAADGSMVCNSRGAHFIEFQVTDKQILRDIQEVVGSNHTISAKKRNENWKTQYRLQIGSKEWFSDLERIGFTQSKSRVLKFPRLPKKYRGDFIRGYFDGDGGVYFKKYRVMDRSNPRWVFSSRFTSGSEDFLVDLHFVLKQCGIQKGFILTKSRKNGYDLVLSHRDSLALYRLMYNNAPRIYLKRKYRVFKKAVKTLYRI
jgi:hypothetical protein